jgi:hypothetical protein
MYPQCRIPYDSLDVKEIEAFVESSTKAATSDVTVSINIHKNKASVEPFCLHVCWPENEDCPNGWVGVSLTRLPLYAKLIHT